MLDRLLGLFSRDIGIDLGTANTLVHVRDRGIVMSEPSVVAIDAKTKRVLAIGAEAKRMVGRTPANIIAVRPLRDGVISDFDVTEQMIKYFVDKVHDRVGSIARPRMLLGIPSGVTEVEKRAVRDAALNAGARWAGLIEEPMAAAIGAGLPVSEPSGSLIVDIGGGTTEVAVISLGGIVVSRSIRIGGDEMDQDIVTFARREYNLFLGERTAEDIKIAIGSAYPGEWDAQRVSLRGRDLLTGLPRSVEVGADQIREAIEPSVQQIVDTVKDTIEETPPELVADIMDQGIVLAGGGALLAGLDRRVAEATQMPVHIADDPLTCVARGTGVVLQDLDRDAARPRVRDVLAPAALSAAPAVERNRMTSVLATRAARRRGIAFIVLLVITVMLMAFSSNPAVREVQNGDRLRLPPDPGRPRRGRRGRRLGRRGRRRDRPAAAWTTRPSGPRTSGWRPRTPGSRRSGARTSQLTALLQLRAGLDYKTVGDQRHRPRIVRVPAAGRPRQGHRRRDRRRATSAVAAGGALAGRVVEVGPDSAKVVLLTDGESTVIGQLTTNAATGEVVGQLGGVLIMRQIDAGETVAVGDEVVTAGIELGGGVRSPYPKGLLIGQVVDVKRDANDVVQTAFLQPAAELDKLEYLLVITDYQGGLPPIEEQPVDCGRAARCPRASSRASRRRRAAPRGRPHRSPPSGRER